MAPADDRRQVDVMMEIEIETLGGGFTYREELVADLPGMLAELGAQGASVSRGGVAGGLGVSFGLDVAEGVFDAATFGECARLGMDIFQTACDKLGLVHGEIARVSVLTEEMLGRELDREPETFLGVSELAMELGVTRQRVSELRARRDFPAPVAELAAGPVWRLASLRRFVATWDRKPGRPRRDQVAG